MESIQFYKYHGTGNDFIIIDNRAKSVNSVSQEVVAKLCDRRFGIGADGLILLEQSGDHDFSMVYFNADGLEGSMCGNGGRCIVAFANKLKIISDSSVFMAVDGVHQAKILSTQPHHVVSLRMNDVNRIEKNGNNFFMNTGSPHLVIWNNQLDSLDVQREGSSIRFSEKYRAEGVNVNFVERNDKKFSIRTYERGVEAETFSCGTGTVASALALSLEYDAHSPVLISSPGGLLEVKFTKTDSGFNNIWLTGPAVEVYSGTINTKMFL